MEPTIRSEHLTASELALLGALRRGEREAAAALLRPQLASLLALARRLNRDPHAAEDLVQETLLRACPALPQFRGECPLRSWLFRIMVRTAADLARAGKRRPTLPFELTDVPDHLPQPDALVQARELQDRMREAIERLSPRESLALHLRATEGMDYSAIAVVLECSAGAARMLVLTARRKILARIEEHLEP